LTEAVEAILKHSTEKKRNFTETIEYRTISFFFVPQ